MLTRSYRSQESLVRYWAKQAIEHCYTIDDVAATNLSEHVPPVLEAIRSMEQERRVMVVGGDGCGKSSILAALGGSPLMAQVPLEGAYVRWRFRNDGDSAEHCRFIPLEHLEGLELVDSRSCASAETAAALRTLLPGTDVLIAVMDGRRVEESPVWELLATPEGAAIEHIMLAVTFDASPQLGDTLRELCRERLRRRLPVYCINPTSATTMEAFCERVQNALNAPSGLRAAIRQVSEASVDLMYKQGSVLKSLEATDRTSSSFLRHIEEEIDNFLARQRSGLPRLMEAYVDVARRSLPRLQRRLSWVFGWVFSPVTVLRLELLGSGCELFYYRHLRDDVLRFQADSDRQFILSCSVHWKSARPRMLKELSCDIGEFPEEQLARELAGLRGRLGCELHQPFAREQMRLRMGKLFTARSGWMRNCHTFICLFLFFAGLLGLLGQDLPAVLLAGVSVLIWLGATIAHLVAKRRIRLGIEELGKLLENSARMTLQESVGYLVTSRVTAYRRLYALPRRKVDELQARLKPLQDDHQYMTRQIRAAAMVR